MKKFMALLLAALLVLGVMPLALAANANEGSVVVNATASTNYAAGGLRFMASAEVGNNSGAGNVTVSGNTFTLKKGIADYAKDYCYILTRYFTSSVNTSETLNADGTLPEGVIEITQAISFSEPENSVYRPKLTCDTTTYSVSNGNIMDSNDICFMKYGEFFDGETECKANTEYILTTTFNTAEDVMTWNVKNDAENVDVSKTYQYSTVNSEGNLDSLESIYYIFNGKSETIEATVKDFTVNVKSILFPHVERLTYTDGEEVILANDELVPPTATSVKAFISGAVDKADSSSTVATLKKVVGGEETTVGISESFTNRYAYTDGYESYVTVTPADGFEAGADYKLYITNLKDAYYGAVMPEGGLVAEFSVQDVISINAPKDGALIASSSVELSAYVPYPENGAKFILDGAEIVATPGAGNVYTAQVEGLASGSHIFTVVSGDEKSVVFSTAQFSDEKTIEYVAPANGGAASVTNGTPTGGCDNPVITQVDGVDGTQNGAIDIYGPSTDGYDVDMSFATAYNNGILIFESDLSKNENAKFILYLGNGKYVADGNPIIAARSGGVSKILDTTKTLNHYEWCNLRIFHELKNNGKYYVYCNGELIKVGTSTANTSSISAMRMQIPTDGDGRSIRLDNARYGNITSPVFVSAAYKTDALAESWTAAEGNVVSGLSQKIKITQINNIASLESAVVTVNGIAATAEIDSTDANSLIITPAEGSINAGEHVVISVNGNVTALKANGDTYDSIGDVEAIIDGDTAVAKVKISKATVGDSLLPETMSLIIASYDSTGTRLLAIDFKTITIVDGYKEYSTDVPMSLNGGTKVRAMLWGGTTVLDPISSDEASVSAN